MAISTKLLAGETTKIPGKEPQSPPVANHHNDYAKQLLAEIRGDHVQQCFGGRLFRRLDRYGNPLISFAVENMNSLEIDRANGAYAAFSSMDAGVFLLYFYLLVIIFVYCTYILVFISIYLIII